MQILTTTSPNIKDSTATAEQIAESQVTFDTVAGHDHDGADSKLVAAGGAVGFSHNFLMMGA
jgi:hypothetical protein